MIAGTVEVICPECDELMPVPITAEIVTDEDGTQRLVADPDMTDVWAHMWTHESA